MRSRTEAVRIQLKICGNFRRASLLKSLADNFKLLMTQKQILAFRESNKYLHQ